MTRPAGDDLVDDGFSWRKYAQNYIKGANHPRLAHLDQNHFSAFWLRCFVAVLDESCSLLFVLF
jgi:hypothetical protein